MPTDGPRNWIALALTAGLFSCGGNCGQPFSTQSQVTRLRILGVQAEPADIVWPIDQDPRKVTLTALVVDPNGSGRTVDATFRYCRPLTEPPTFRQVSDLPPIIGPAELDCPSETEPTLPFAGAIAATYDALFAVRHYGKPSPVDGGLPEGLPVPPGGVSVLEGLALYRAGFDLVAGEERVRGYKSLRLAVFAPANQNPGIKEVEIDGERLTDSPLVVVGMGQAHTLRALPAPGSFETYVEEGGDGASRTETLTYSFHATHGNVELHATERLDGGATIDEPRAEWFPPSDNPLTGFRVPVEGLTVTFYVVVRDERGGTGWTSRKLLVKRGSNSP